LIPVGISWGVLQEYWVQGFVNRRAMQSVGRGPLSITITAAVFGLLHMPNPLLASATFAVGLPFAWVYQKRPNLYALGLAHSILTVVLISSFPDELLGGLRVGLQYFR
ncbi:MAG: CPBP family intramembrane metalloprotease, partial [Acidobacteria bacterium]|nr:CPBP family intramembrane metalloprotease [Acidobacteriota bacterium]